MSNEDKIKALEEAVTTILDMLEKQQAEIEAIKKTTVKKATGLFGGKRERTAIKDTTTGKIYPSKASVGKNLASEADADPLDHFAWYKLIAKFPDRFVPASTEEAEKVWAEEKARVEKEVAEANKRLEAEAATKKAAEAKK